MKKFLSFLMAMVIAVGAWAQGPVQVLEPSKVLDNVEATIKSGVTDPVVHTPKHLRSISGVELHKNLTPITGIGIEGNWTVNTSKSKTAFDHQLVGAFATTNLMNLFAGYPGVPRLFEIRTVVGIGWLHEYMNGPGDLNSWYTKYGLDLRFNLNDKFAISLKPAIVYNMKDGAHTRYNVNNAYLEAQVGLTYKFKNSNGKHNFAYTSMYTQADIDALNAEINELRAREPEIREVIVERVVTNAVEVVPVAVLENAIGFTINSYKVLPTEMANLANIADVLINNPDINLTIKGYADANTGTPEYNANLATKRAQAVKDVLVDMGIDADRLTIEGIGSAIQPYSTNNWNRAVLFEVR